MMRDVLLNLNKEVGVKGSLIVSRDGVIIAAEVAPPLVGDQVGAIASDSIRRINGSLRALGSDEFTRYFFNATYGRMIFMETGEPYLVVVLDQHINLDFTLLAVSSAARKIRNLGSLA